MKDITYGQPWRKDGRLLYTWKKDITPVIYTLLSVIFWITSLLYSFNRSRPWCHHQLILYQLFVDVYFRICLNEFVLVLSAHYEFLNSQFLVEQLSVQETVEVKKIFLTIFITRDQNFNVLIMIHQWTHFIFSLFQNRIFLSKTDS